MFIIIYTLEPTAVKSAERLEEARFRACGFTPAVLATMSYRRDNAKKVAYER